MVVTDSVCVRVRVCVCVCVCVYMKVCDYQYGEWKIKMLSGKFDEEGNKKEKSQKTEGKGEGA